MRRWSWPSGGGGLGGLTMSEDGGLEEVEESFRAAASCACSWAKATWRVFSCACWDSNCAWRASSCACNRWQFEQECVVPAPIAAYSTLHRISYNTPVNRHGCGELSPGAHGLPSRVRAGVGGDCRPGGQGGLRCQTHLLRGIRGCGTEAIPSE